MSISLQPGEYRLYSQTQTLSVEELSKLDYIKLYPNPTSTSFQINKTVESVSVFDLTGKLVKTYKGSFNNEHTFDITTLPKSLYLVKAINELGEVSTTKLIKI